MVWVLSCCPSTVHMLRNIGALCTYQIPPHLNHCLSSSNESQNRTSGGLKPVAKDAQCLPSSDSISCLLIGTNVMIKKRQHVSTTCRTIHASPKLMSAGVCKILLCSWFMLTQTWDTQATSKHPNRAHHNQLHINLEAARLSSLFFFSLSLSLSLSVLHIWVTL